MTYATQDSTSLLRGFLGFGTIALVALAGCRQEVELEPAPDARTTDQAAVDNVRGVRVVVQEDEWPGLDEVKNHVTPMKVRIENESDHPLLVRYDTFSLIDTSSGEVFSALPPYEIDESQPGGQAVFRSSMESAEFEHSEFRVAPYYATVYPGMMTYYGAPYYYDPGYHRAYYSYWGETALPTDEMLRRVLPEGVIDPGGSVSGYLYFERVPADLNRVAFRAELQDVESGERFGTITIPFEVSES